MIKIFEYSIFIPFTPLVILYFNKIFDTTYPDNVIRGVGRITEPHGL